VFAVVEPNIEEGIKYIKYRGAPTLRGITPTIGPKNLRKSAKKSAVSAGKFAKICGKIRGICGKNHASAGKTT
jgi:hypothetical protein